MYNYKRHLDQIPTILKTARHEAVTIHDDTGREIGTQPAYDYQPAQAWVLKIDTGSKLHFHHDQTENLLKALESSSDEDLGDEVATLYKVDPRRAQQNVRANSRILATELEQIKAAILANRLKETERS